MRRRALLALVPAAVILSMSSPAGAQTAETDEAPPESSVQPEPGIPQPAPEEGAQPGDGADPEPGAQTSPGTAADPTIAPVQASIRLRVSRHVRNGGNVRAHGAVAPAARRWVAIKVDGRRVATVRTRTNGTFSVSFAAGRTGIHRARAVASGSTGNRSIRSKLKLVNVYRPAPASWYGPGLYGNRTACGQTLTPSIVGVANRSLPCGTKLTLRVGKRSLTVRVIDRGPYAAGREFDLTAATRQKLGFGSTGTVLTTK